MTLTGIFNLVVDPFSMFGLVKIKGTNEQKPEFGKHVRMIKAHTVRLLKPSGIILGSSRAEYGIDPEHPGWSIASRPVYNLALPSGSMYEALRYLQHAQAIKNIEEVVLALDLFMFNANWQKADDYRDDRLATPATFDLNTGWLRDMTTTLFSIDAIRASIETIASQSDPNYVGYLMNGARHPLDNWNKIRSKGGHHAAFINNEKYSLTAPDGWALFSLGDPAINKQATLDNFRKLVSFSREHNIRMYVLISPVHARKLEVLWQLGLWDTFEKWKRALVNILAADVALYPDSPSIPLYDFTGYYDITTEDLPKHGDNTSQMQWYWEGSHYKKRVGDLMLDRIFAHETNKMKITTSFGASIKPDNIESHLAQIRADHNYYMNTHPEDIEEIKMLILETSDERENLIRTMTTPPVLSPPSTKPD